MDIDTRKPQAPQLHPYLPPRYLPASPPIPNRCLTALPASTAAPSQHTHTPLPYPTQVLDSIARKHRSSIPNVASKWVLDRPGVAGIILGARNADHVQVGLLVGRAGGGV